MAQPETIDALLADAYTREEVAQALLTLEDTDDTPDVRQLKRAIKTLPVLTLYVPRALSRESVRRVGEWARRELDPHALLEVHVEAQAAGGCLFAWKGVLHDYSLARTLRDKEVEYGAHIKQALATP